MKNHLEKLSLFTACIYTVIRSCIGFHQIAWGTGKWLGEYSIKWGMLFFIYLLFCMTLVIFSGFALWRSERIREFFGAPIKLRESMGNLRWIPAFFILIAPVWFLQYTPWGMVFRDIYIRLLIWVLVVFAFTFIITKENNILKWSEFLAALVLTSSEFIIAAAFINVNDYPFSLGWSEGNRMWDYSMLFGMELYNIPASQKVEVLLETGRQIIGALPFLIPNLTIQMERFWLACMLVIPYLLLGIAIFYSKRANPKVWMLATLWALIFLKQGPIHPPLVLCAAIVALLWRKPLWLGIPLIFITSYFARISRYTWMFAPGMWIGMLELAGAALQNKKLHASAWARAIILGLTGVAGGQLGAMLIEFVTGKEITVSIMSFNTAVANVTDSSQPLLWDRLLPNSTYRTGILIGLLIATLPLLITLLYLVITKKWQLNIWQSLSIFAPLSAFLGVGLIVSTKIGGGGDLHNMDMFLAGLLFTAALAWHNGGMMWIQDSRAIPFTIKIVIILCLFIPALSSLRQIRSHRFNEDTKWLITLADIPDEKSLGMLPSQKIIDKTMQTIQREVSIAQQKGDILFMDQRQLLTFGYIKNVPLITEYEKKVLMNEALRSNAEYFSSFYADLAAQRFSLIISNPLHRQNQDETFYFGEENNAWVKWVSNPILCYYERKTTFTETGVQLLYPIANPLNCAEELPSESKISK